MHFEIAENIIPVVVKRITNSIVLITNTFPRDFLKGFTKFVRPTEAAVWIVEVDFQKIETTEFMFMNTCNRVDILQL